MLCRKLPLSDRATMLPWLWAVLDVNSSPEVYARYDKMTAKELFQRSACCERPEEPEALCFENQASSG